MSSVSETGYFPGPKNRRFRGRKNGLFLDIQKGPFLGGPENRSFLGGPENTRFWWS